jgi:uncharacterized protein
MFVNLKKLDKSSNKYFIKLSDRNFIRILSENNITLNSDYDFLAEIALSLKGLRLTAQVKLKTSVILECGRCLNTYNYNINETLNLIYVPSESDKDAGASGGKKNIELKEEEMDIGYYDDNSVDLYNIFIEAVNLLIPLNPLCSHDCKGLCPSCGADLNKKKCTCTGRNTIIYNYN